MRKAIKKYNNCIGTFLVALYLFIATPISFWHNHLNCKEANGHFGVSTIAFKKAAIKSIDSNCSICSTSHYSVFYNNNCSLLIRPITYHQFPIDVIVVKLPFIKILNEENRGPPSV